jgi:anti-sigma B factor antagonist
MGRYGRGAAFTVDTRPGRRGTTIIEASGELDFHTGPMLRDSVLHSVTAGNPEIVLDLGGLEFLDSTGLAVLIRGLKECRAAGGAFTIACLKPGPERTLRTAGVLRLFDVYDTITTAEESFTIPNRIPPRVMSTTAR